MTLEEMIDRVSVDVDCFEAGVDLDPAYQLVMLNEKPNLEPFDPALDLGAGITPAVPRFAQNAAKAGQRVIARESGYTWAIAGAAITARNPVMPDPVTLGQVIEWAWDDTVDTAGHIHNIGANLSPSRSSIKQIVGFAMTDAASPGDLVLVKIHHQVL
jgi:hypothetical protein